MTLGNVYVVATEVQKCSSYVYISMNKTACIQYCLDLMLQMDIILLQKMSKYQSNQYVLSKYTYVYKHRYVSRFLATRKVDKKVAL